MIVTISVKHEDKKQIINMNEWMKDAGKMFEGNPVLSDEVKNFYRMTRNIVGQIAEQMENYGRVNRQINKELFELKSA